MMSRVQDDKTTRGCDVGKTRRQEDKTGRGWDDGKKRVEWEGG